MSAIMRFPSRAAAGPRLGGSPAVTSTTGYPWADGDVLYADDLNAAFLPLYGGETITSDINAGGRILQGYATAPPTWASGSLGGNVGIGWYELIAEAQFYTKTGGIAVAAVGRASDYHSGSETPQIYAFAGYGIADVAPGTAEGMYLEAHKAVAGATAICIEMDAINTGGPIPTINPYQPLNTGANVGLVIAAGGGAGERPGPLYPASAAIIIGSNATNFNMGIVFGATCVQGTDGVTGHGTAIQLAKGHEIQWTFNNTGARSSFIRCDATASSMGIVFETSGVAFVSADTETTYLQVNPFNTTVTGTLVSPIIQFNSTSGPTIRGGTGAAAGVAPKGSLWLRTDGAVGSTLYVTQGGGTWNAVAAV